MLYHLFENLQQITDFSGAGLFQYISFRAGMAVITSLIISMLFGDKLIQLLRKKQVGESIRDLGLDGQVEKAGTPTMGGLIILGAILIPTLLFAKLDNVYTITMVIATIWLGLIGFIDDYIKVFKKNKKGLAGRFKIVGQVGVGIIVGSLLYFSDAVVVKEKVAVNQSTEISVDQSKQFTWVESKSTKTTIPFFKNNEFDYSWFGLGEYTWIAFILIVIIILCLKFLYLFNILLFKFKYCTTNKIICCCIIYFSHNSHSLLPRVRLASSSKS